jgi:hypothetical protein
VAGMVAGPGESLDHGGDAGQGPVVGVEAAGAGTWRSVVSRSWSCWSLRRGSGPVGPRLASASSPPAGQRAGQRLTFWRATPYFTGDLGLGAASGKQRPGLHADVFEGLAVAQTAGVAAICGWSHPAMLPGQPRPCHRNRRTSLTVVC